jgi:hypothetical protein
MNLRQHKRRHDAIMRDRWPRKRAIRRRACTGKIRHAAPAPAPVFGDDRVREKQAGGHVAQHKAERDRVKFPRKRKSRR